MPSANFLERLISDWYEHRGYFVRSNIKFGPRPNGGYEGEIDLLAIDPKTRTLFHVETSSDANSWTKRKDRITRKFAGAKAHYATHAAGTFDTVRRIAVVGVGKSKTPVDLPDIEVLSLDDLMREIKAHVLEHPPASKVIPEHYGYLRAVQFTVWYGGER